MTRISSKLNHIGRRLSGRPAFPPTSAASSVPATTYFEPDNQWHLPAMAGPSTFVPDVCGGAVVRRVLDESHPGLAELWRDEVALNPRFSSYTFAEVGFGVSFAIRKFRKS